MTGSPICGDAEACGAGAVVGPHGVVAGVGARLPCRALVCICKKKQKGMLLPTNYSNQFMQLLAEVNKLNGI